MPILDRRRLLALVAAASALSSGGYDAGAAPRETLLDVLYNLSWIPDGSPAEKHAYVIFAPWCPVCKQLFKEARPLVSHVQLRWIPAGSRAPQWRRCNAVMGLSRDPRQLMALFASGRQPDAEPTRYTSIDLNEGVIATRVPEISEIAGSRFGYPTVVYRDASGVRAVAGLPRDLEKRLAAAVIDTNFPVDGSKSIALLRRPVSETPLLDGQHVHARKAAYLRALPFADAPIVAGIRGGDSDIALAEVKTDAGPWFAVPLGRGGLRAYASRSDVDLRAA